MVPGKTDGAYPAEQVVSISLDELRRRDYDAVCEKLMGVSGFNKVVVNAVCYDDVAVFVTAYLRRQPGARYLCSAARQPWSKFWAQ